MPLKVENWNEYRKGHSELLKVTDHRVMKNDRIWLTCVPCATDSYKIWPVLCTRLRKIFLPETLLTFSRGDTKYPPTNKDFLNLKDIRLHMGHILLGILALSYGMYCLQRAGTFLHCLCSRSIFYSLTQIPSLLMLSTQIALYVVHNEHSTIFTTPVCTCEIFF